MTPYIIGIVGGSGSGKSTLLRALAAHFDRTQVCVISHDEYYHKREDQPHDPYGKVVDGIPVRNFDLPESIKHDDFYTDLQLLIQGKETGRTRYNFNNERAEEETIIYKPAPVIIVEGLFIFHEKRIRDLVNLKVFVHSNDALKVIRRIIRDKRDRNYPAEDVLYRYEKHVLPSYHEHIAPYRDLADIVINNNVSSDQGLEVLKGFIASKV